MTTLIVNADDFGYSEGVNYGIISAFQNGIVRSTTMMPNMPAAVHGAALLQQNPGLGCGIHLTLSCYKPLLTTHRTIVDESGMFHRRLTPDVLATFDLNEVYEEFCAQIEYAKSLGVDISHLDSHHHVHTLEALKPVFERLLDKYPYLIRGGFEYELNYDRIIPLMDEFYQDEVNESFFEKYIDKIKKFEAVDLMSHPAFVDEFLLNSTSYAINRTKEHCVLTSAVVKDYLSAQGIELGNYNGL